MSWPSTPLIDMLSSLESGSRPKGGATTSSGEIPSIGGEHIDSDGGFRFENLKLVPRDFFISMRTGRVRRHDILLVKDGATTGKTSIVRDGFPFDDCAVNEHVFVLRPDVSKVDPSFLFHYLRSPGGVAGIMSDFRGATIGGISRNFATKTAVPLPPLPEQRRIAAILDQADALRAKRRQALARLNALTQSVFIEMFGDPIGNAKGLPTLLLREIGQVVTGNTPSRARSEFYGSAIEWVKSDNLNTDEHYATRATERLSDIGKTVARTAPPRAILVTCIAGSPSSIGNAAIVDREVAFNQQINALIPHTGDTYFLYAQILVGKRLIQDASTASMKGMVSKSRFENIRLLFPAVEAQQQFGELFKRIEQTKSAQRASRGGGERLFSALQHRAFRGEL